MTGEQVLLFLMLHFVGDYVTQTHRMAVEKLASMRMATLHAMVYALPFLFVFHMQTMPWFILMYSHAIIDHYRLSRYIIFAKNWLHDPSLKWQDCKRTGSHSTVPDYLAVWMNILVDNICHITINYFCIIWY